MRGEIKKLRSNGGGWRRRGVGKGIKMRVMGGGGGGGLR